MEKTETTPLRVLMYTDGEEYVAHVLEFDIVGTGSTESEAEQQLVEAIDCHLSFCAQMEMNPFRRAPQGLIDAWEADQRSHLFPTPQVTPKHEKKATVVNYARRQDNTVFEQYSVTCG